MPEKKLCPDCNREYESDYEFCIDCGSKLQTVIRKKLCPVCNKEYSYDYEFCIDCGRPLLTFVEKEIVDESEFIHCPECDSLNKNESIECSSCGYLLKQDIKNSPIFSLQKAYKNCPLCGNVASLNAKYCSICGFDFPDFKFEHDSFFSENPQYAEYEKNIDFINSINKSGQYLRFVYEFKEYCLGNDIDITLFDTGLIACPQCSNYFSFISPHFLINYSCPHCSEEFDIDFVKDVYCFNCGRPVGKNQEKCQCGFEFKDVRCPNCCEWNSYTSNTCVSCGKPLWSHNVVFDTLPPKGCGYGKNKELVIDSDFIEKQVLKNPYDEAGTIYLNTLYREIQKHNIIMDEIHLRWWVVSPLYCKSCQSIIYPFKNTCPNCGINHWHNRLEDPLKALKGIDDNYVGSSRTLELSTLKWSYKLGDDDLNVYINSLAPMAGESQQSYRKRLIREYGENSAILYIIRVMWGIYFNGYCINCGSEFGQYNHICPSCGMKKEVPLSSVMLTNENVVSDSFPRQYSEFRWNLKNILEENGGNISHFDEGIAGCPNCDNYFRYMTPEFINTHKCPHCGSEFLIGARIYQDEYELSGLSYEEYMEMFYGFDFK